MANYSEDHGDFAEAAIANSEAGRKLKLKTLSLVTRLFNL
jgi:hypothetical protein